MDLVQRLRGEAAYSSTFDKASKLLRSGGVLSCDVEQGAIEGAVYLSGLVRSSTPGLAYRARVSLSLSEDDIVDYACTCPVGGSAVGMCKHEVALALHYLAGTGALADVPGPRRSGAAAYAVQARPAATGSGAEGRSTYDGGASSAAHGRLSAPSNRGIAAPAATYAPSNRGFAAPASTYAPPTSPQLASLISGAVARRAEEAARGRGPRAQAGTAPAYTGEPVELLVRIAPSASAVTGEPASQTWLLRLRMRRGKAIYVVKNVAELARAYRERREVSYGKHLAFVHVPEAFDARSRSVLELVARVAQSQQALFLSRYTYQAAGRGSEVKELPLSAPDVVELLDCLQGAEVEFELGGYPASPARTLRVATGTSEVPARLVPSAGGGYDLVLPPQLYSCAAGDALYLFDDARALRCPPDYARAAGAALAQLLPASRPLHIGERDLPEFCRSVLPLLEEVTSLSAPDEIRALVPPVPGFTFRIGLEDGEVSCQATVAYGGRSLGLYEPRRTGQPTRDLVAEYHAQDVLEAYFPGTGDDLHFDESDDELLYLLLTDGLRELGELGEVLLSERLRSVAVKDSPQVRVRATVKSGLLDVAVDSSGMAAHDLRLYLESFKRRQHYVRLSTDEIVKIGDNLRTVDSLAEGLNVDVTALADGVTGLPEGLSLFVDGLLKKAGQVRLDRSAGFRAIVREFETISDADIEMPASLADVLRSYQVAGVRWLGTLERFGFGGILADDMGLGKTLQVIAHVLACKEKLVEGNAAGTAQAAACGATGDARALAHGVAEVPAQGIAGTSECPSARETTLVVAPASLVYNWTAEFARFAPSLDVVAVVGTKAARTRLIGAAASHDVLVTSYDLMKRDVKAYASQHFRRVVLDEAQYIKNAGTQVAKSAKCLPADVRFALTGTPIENRLSELWSIFDFLMPGILGTRDEFAKRFESPVEHGEFEATRRLQCLVAPFILRRLKADVLADLPEKTESVVLAQMGPEQEKLYRANQDRLALQVQHELPDEFKKERLKVLAELTKLRQICCDPRLYFEDYAGGSAKLDACVELVRNAVDGSHGVLVFSQFTAMLGILGKRLRAERLPYLQLTGSTSKEERARLVAAFQAGEAPVMLVSLKAGGVGLNLTAADVVIHYDPWWNLAAQNQATDRAYRIGQNRSVSVFKLIAQGTVEERIVEMQERKRDLAEAVLGGEGLSSTRITQADILALLGAHGGEAGA